jgi:hypothetical protein
MKEQLEQRVQRAVTPAPAGLDEGAAAEVTSRAEAGAVEHTKDTRPLCAADMVYSPGAPPGVRLVRVRPDAVNDTPDPLSVYTLTEAHSGAPLPTGAGAEPLRCETCGVLFEQGYSSLFAHQGAPCEPPPGGGAAAVPSAHRLQRGAAGARAALPQRLRHPT